MLMVEKSRSMKKEKLTVYGEGGGGGEKKVNWGSKSATSLPELSDTPRPKIGIDEVRTCHRQPQPTDAS